MDRAGARERILSTTSEQCGSKANKQNRLDRLNLHSWDNSVIVHGRKKKKKKNHTGSKTVIEIYSSIQDLKRVKAILTPMIPVMYNDGIMFSHYYTRENQKRKANF